MLNELPIFFFQNASELNMSPGAFSGQNLDAMRKQEIIYQCSVKGQCATAQTRTETSLETPFQDKSPISSIWTVVRPNNDTANG